MTEAVAFLHALGQALAAGRFYATDHPARARALDHSFERMERLLESEPHPRFTMLESDIVYQRRVLAGFRDWEWGLRLASAGIRRIEIDRGATKDELERFLDEVLQRLAGPAPSALARQFGTAAIRFGEIALDDATIATATATRAAGAATATITAEAETIRWVHDEVSAGRTLPMIEAEIVVQCLAAAMHRQRGMVLPLLELRDFDEYTTTHASNVAVLTMALAEYMGFPPGDVRTLGVCGLLHDVGKTRIPKDVLTKPGALAPEERALIETHTIEGGRILLGFEAALDIAAIVAYEHHLLIDGRGYPKLRYARESHYASQLVHVCDVFDALCTHRPYRDAWSAERALQTIQSESGTSFIPEIVDAFVTMIRSAGQERLPLADEGTPAPAPA